MKEHRKDSWLPAILDDPDVAALKSLAAGEANSGQQRRAIECIMFRICGLRDEPFNPGINRHGVKVDGERITNFLLGRRNVGLQIARAIERPSKIQGEGAATPNTEQP